MTRKLTPAQLDEIEATAKKATPGPWEANMPPDIIAVDPETGMYGSGVIELEDYYDDPPARNNAKAEDLAHIAMMDPATTLALVAEVRELRVKVERVRVQAQQVLNKHSDGPYGVGAADQAYLTIKALGEKA